MKEMMHSAELPASVMKLRDDARKFVSIMKHRVGHSFCGINDDDRGIIMRFTQGVLLSSPNTPLCVKPDLCLQISAEAYDCAEISPCETFNIIADLDYVSEICIINRRILSKESVITNSYYDDSVDGGNLKKVSILYQYNGLYQLDRLIKNPKLISKHMNNLKSDLRILYSMLMNQFHAREEEVIGCPIIMAPIRKDDSQKTECDTCKGCRDWKY